jgi:purine nucleoside permease
MKKMTNRRRALPAMLLLLGLVTLAGMTATSRPADASPGSDRGSHALRVKVLIVTMFDLETEPWLNRENLTRKVVVPTVTEPVRCDTRGECVAVVGQGKVNAATSLSAILDDAGLDFSDAHFITSGIAGTSPTAGTLGFAALADEVVDYELGHHVSPATDPAIPHGYLKGEDVGTNVFHLNADLVRMASKLTAHVPLADDATAAANRAHYPGQAGKKPFVTTCATVTADDFWIGKDASETADYVVKQWTGGKGRYCTSQEEDNATAGVLAKHGYLDRYLSVRTASDFDQPYAGQSATEALNAFPGAAIAIENAYRVTSTISHHLLTGR